MCQITSNIVLDFTSNIPTVGNRRWQQNILYVVEMNIWLLVKLTS